MSVESVKSGLLPVAIKFTFPQAMAIYAACFLLFSLFKLITERVGDASHSVLISLATLGPAIVALPITAFL